MKGNVTNTGYWPDSPDRNNDFNIIPSNQITMEGMDMPLLGISNTGDKKLMMPGKNYKFKGESVMETPVDKGIFLGKFKQVGGQLVPHDISVPNLSRQQGGEAEENQSFAKSIISKTLDKQEQDPESMFYGRYNTPLTKREQKGFDEWIAKESERQGRDISMDKGAYDIQGFWKAGDWKRMDADNHGTDTWKKPNHPTFSNHSRYHGADGWYGGNWTEEAGYQPSKQTINTYGPDYYSWMFGNEPNRPEHLDMSRYDSGKTAPVPVVYNQGGSVKRVKIKSLPNNWKSQ